jgi:two-component system nitrate/nitrite response regulator NarL
MNCKDGDCSAVLRIQQNEGTASMKPIRTFIVDDSPGFINALMNYLSSEAGIEIVGFALLGHEAVEMLADTKPDLVLMDYRVPEINGIDVMAHIKTLPDSPRVITLCMHDIPAYQEAAKAAGADGWVSKNNLAEELMPLIDCLFNNVDEKRHSNCL